MQSIPNKIQLPTDKKFGFFLTFVFLIASIYFYIKGNSLILYCFIFITISLLVITLVKAEMLRPLNKLWMSLGFLLGSIVNPIIMGLVFFLIFSPIGILLRLLGRDELFLQNRKRKSYWIKRNEEEKLNSFKFQF